MRRKKIYSDLLYEFGGCFCLLLCGLAAVLAALAQALDLAAGRAPLDVPGAAGDVERHDVEAVDLAVLAFIDRLFALARPRLVDITHDFIERLFRLGLRQIQIQWWGICRRSGNRYICPCVCSGNCLPSSQV